MDDAEAEKMFLVILLENIRQPISTNLESSESSISSSDSDTDTDLKTSRVCFDDSVEAVIRNYTDEEFRAHFRMNRLTTHHIIDQFVTIVAKHPGGWPKVTAAKICYMTIWYLSNQETFRQIGDRFNVSRGCAYKIIKKAVEFLRTLAPKYIQWPSENAMKVSSSSFSNQGITNIIGIIDGSHISIKKPHVDGDDYINRKGYTSVVLQGVVDYSLKFINISVGEPGSLNEGQILRRSLIYRKAQEDDHLFRDHFLLGDLAYPSLNWLVPPYKDNNHLTPQQKLFNSKHSSARFVGENAFGLLKGRFKRLNHFENNNVKLIIDCVIAACVLHNICQSNDDVGDDFVEIEPNDESEEDFDAEENVQNKLQARDIVFAQMFQQK